MKSVLVIFDIDGTLCDTFDVDDRCFCAAASSVLNMPIGLTSWTQAEDITDAGVTDWLWRRLLHRSPAVEEIQALVAVYETEILDELANAPHRFAVVPGVHSMLKRLNDSGFTIAIATGGWSRIALIKLAAAYIPPELLLASSDDSKNRLEVFRLARDRAAARRGASFERTVLVGDGVWDVKVAAKHGWGFLGVGKKENARRLLQAGAPEVVEDFSNPDRVCNLLEKCSIPIP